MNKKYIKSILLSVSISLACIPLGQYSAVTTLASTHINSSSINNNYILKADSSYNSTSIKSGKTTTNLNFRKEPSISSSIIKVLPTNSSIIILGEYNGFYRIDYNGTIGYISKQYVKIVDSKMIKSTNDMIGVTTNLAKSLTLNLRNGPGVNYNILKKLPQKSAFKILSKHDNWYIINYNGTIGYIYDYYVNALNHNDSKFIDFIALQEGFSSIPYKDATGHWTVGFGENYGDRYPKSETYSEALANLIDNVDNFRGKVKRITAGLDLNENQLNALTDFAFNLGTNSLRNSRLLKNLKSGIRNPKTIKSDFQAWSYGNSRFLKALYNRRTAEANIFLYGEY